MIRSKTPADAKILATIDLTGPDENAFVLIGIARRAAKKLGLDEKTIVEEMQAGDYEDLLQVFEKYFGAFYTLLR